MLTHSSRSLAVALALGACAAASAVTLKTADGLELAFDAQGAVTAVSVNGQALPVRGPGGFFVRDVAADGALQPVLGKVTTQKDTLAFTGSCPALQVTLTATFTAGKRKLDCAATLRDLTGQDRALSLVFAVPVDAVGWQWYQHLSQPVTVAADRSYEETVPLKAGGGGMARYCWTALTDSKAGLCLGLPMDQPALYRLVYDGAARQLQIRYDVGLVKESKQPSAATVHFLLYKLDEPQWGMRSALKKYYELYPQWFVKRAKTEGIWKNFDSIEKIPGWQDFHFAHHEGPSDSTAVAFDRDHAIHSYFYDEPWDYWLTLPSGRKYTTDEVVAALREQGSKPGPHREGAALSSAMFDENGQIIGHFTDVPWCYGGWFEVNVDPDLPAGNEGGLNAGQFSQQAYLKALAPAARPQVGALAWARAGGPYALAQPGHIGKTCVTIANPTDGPGSGLVQSLDLNQTQPAAITVSAWSKAQGVAGISNANYGLLAEVTFRDDTRAAVSIPFAPGDHAWQNVTQTLRFDKPVASLALTVGFFYHRGTAWFDDISVRQEGSTQEVCRNGGFEQQETERRYDGAYFDGAPDYCGEYLNYRRDHFKFADVPLTWASDSKRVVELSLFSNWEYFVWMCDQLHKLGMLTMSNGPMRQFGFYDNVCDVAGTEIWWAGGPDKFTPESDAILSFRRAFSYQKPYLLLMCQVQHFSHEMVENYLKKSLAYGMMPAMNGGSWKEGDKWTGIEFYESAMRERDRQAYRDIMPAIIELAEAGWEPMTYATANAPVVVERYGYGEKQNLHFTVYNEGPAAQSFDLTIEADKLGLGKQPPQYAVDMLGKRFLKLDRQGRLLVLKGIRLAPLGVLSLSLVPEGNRQAIPEARVRDDLQALQRDLASRSGVPGAAGITDELGRWTAASTATLTGSLLQLQVQQQKLPPDPPLQAALEAALADLGLYGQGQSGLRVLAGDELSADGTRRVVTATLVNANATPLRQVTLGLRGPAGWTTTGPASARQDVLAPGAAMQLQATFAPPADASAAGALQVWTDVEAAGTKPVRLVASLPLAPIETFALTAREATGEGLAIEAEVRNLSAQPRQAVLEVTPPTQWQAEPARLPVILAAAQTVRQRFVLTPVGEPSAGLYDAVVALKAANGEGVLQQATARFQYFREPEIKGRNLALATAGATATCDSYNGGYTAKPINDGVVKTAGLHWLQAAWASEDNERPHWVEIALPQAQPVRAVVIYWAYDNGAYWSAQRYQVQVQQDGAWRTVADQTKAGNRVYDLEQFAPVVTGRVRVVQPEKGGNAARPGIMWLGEVEAYGQE